jgi:hypothetical protein
MAIGASVDAVKRTLIWMISLTLEPTTPLRPGRHDR